MPFTWTFAYAEVPLPASPAFPSGHTAWRPLLRGRIIALGGQSIDCVLWPDSGADHCVFPLSFGLAIGVDPLTLPADQTGGVGAVNQTYYADITVEIFTTVDDPPISFTVKAGFTDGMEAFGCGLMGQAGFFERFPIAFDHPSRLFRIEIPEIPHTRLPQPQPGTLIS